MIEFDKVLADTLTLLERERRVSYRALKRRFGLDDDYLEDLKAEIIDAKRLAIDEGGTVLIWAGDPDERSDVSAQPAPVNRRTVYTPPHLATKILRSRAALEGERKQVTVLFADIQDSIELSAQMGAEDWHGLLDRFFSILSDEVHRFEGTINQYTGDGVMALFGAPIAHEDHGQRACYAALSIREALRRFSRQVHDELGAVLGVRVGLNSGDVVVGKIGDDLRMDYTAQGHTVGVAQRVEALANAGTVYLSEATAHLVSGYFNLRSLGHRELKGIARPIEIFELQDSRAITSRIEVSKARGLTRFVGREKEMHVLDAALARAMDGFGQVVGVVGEPGLGKSRLCLEFVERCRAQGLTVHESHCPAHGQNVPFLPILELFRSYFDITPGTSDAEARRNIAALVNALDPTLDALVDVLFEFMGVRDVTKRPSTMDSDVRQRLMFDLIHRITRARAQTGETVVVLIDDLHWIDPGSDLYVAQMVEAVENNRVLMLLNFRPEYSAPWTHRSHYQQLSLTPLTSNSITEFLQTLIGTDDSLLELTPRVAAWTGGNPFFAEEVVQMLIETGVLASNPDRYLLARNLEEINLPLNVRSVLAARIDRLDASSKRVLQCAAVIGMTFDAPVLADVAGMERDPLSQAIGTLKDAEFIVETAFYPTVRYTFKHPMSQEVSYASQLGDRRKEAHALVAEALERHSHNRLEENAPLLAQHWEKAGNVERALEWHQRAADWAAFRDPPAALRHWHRVRALVDETRDNPGALSLGALACSHFLLAGWRLGGSLEECRPHFEDGANLAKRADDTVMLASVTGSFGVMAAFVGRGDLYCEYGTEAARLADETGIPQLRAAMRQFSSHSNWFLGNFEEALRFATEAYAITPDDPTWGMEYTNSHARVAALVAHLAIAAVEGRFSDSRGYAAELDAFCARGEFGDQALWGPIFATFAETFAGGAAPPDRAERLVEMAEQIGTEFGSIAAHYGAGIANFTNGDMPATISCFQQFLTIERARNCISMMRPSALAYYAEALLDTGDSRAARENAEEAVARAVATGYRWDSRPWHALARIAIRTNDRSAARAALDTLENEITALGARAYEPLLHELRAEYARVFAADWDADEELRAAEQGFADLGAQGHVDRLNHAHV